MGRGALSVRITPANSEPIRVITAHLKSKLVTYPGNRFAPENEKERAEGAGIALARRTAEAVTLRLHVNKILAETARLILVGDLNDGPHAATSQLLLGPADGNIEKGDGGDAVRLYNLTDALPLHGIKEKVFLPEGENFSRRHEGRGEMLDQILATKKLIFDEGEYRVSQVRSLVNLIEGQNVTGTPGQRVGAEASDHAPVFADFEL